MTSNHNEMVKVCSANEFWRNRGGVKQIFWKKGTSLKRIKQAEKEGVGSERTRRKGWGGNRLPQVTFVIRLEVCWREKDMRPKVILVRTGSTVAFPCLPLVSVAHLALGSSATRSSTALTDVLPEHQIHLAGHWGWFLQWKKFDNFSKHLFFTRKFPYIVTRFH